MSTQIDYSTTCIYYYPMPACQPNNKPAPSQWENYRDNFSRHLISVARHLQLSTMHMLMQDCGHSELRLSFAPYITLIGEQGRRLSELADTLTISRQACNQTVRQLEQAGYVRSVVDSQDRRARQLQLTPNGQRLRRDGVRILRKLDARFAAIIGAPAADEAARNLGRLYSALSLNAGAANEPAFPYTGIGGLLPRLSDYSVHRLMQLTRARGHPQLKLSHGQVLTLIGPGGGRIQQIASIQDVSKQAISAIATELEALGYLQRETDAADARQVVLHFTPHGDQLIADSVASVADLKAEFAAIIGDTALHSLSASLHTLYHGLHLERDIFDYASHSDIGQLADQLKRQLGDEASQTLARLLLNPSR